MNPKLRAADVARFVKRARDAGMPDDEIRSELLSKFDLKPTEELLEGIVFMAELCELPGAETVSLSALQGLSRQGRDAAQVTLELFDRLKPSTNYQKEILALAEEIALRENVSVLEIVSEQMRGLPADIPRARKIEHVRDSLFARRNPALTAYEEEFKRAADETGTDGVAWRHEAAFETPRVTAELSFEKREELEDAVKKLAGALEDGSVDKLLDVCRCEVKIPADTSDKFRGVRAQEDSNA